MTPAEITAQSNALMAAIAERVREREILERSLAERLTRGQRRAVEDRCHELTAANRADQKRLLRLDLQWEARMRGGSTRVAA